MASLFEIAPLKNTTRVSVSEKIRGELFDFCAMFTFLTYISFEAHLRLNLAIFSEPDVKVQPSASSVGNAFFSFDPRNRRLSNVQRRQRCLGVYFNRNAIYPGSIPWKDKFVKQHPQTGRGPKEA